MKNIEIRRAAAMYGLRLWQVAEAVGLNDSAFSRKLRRELSPEDKERVLAAIEELAKEVDGIG